LNRLLRNLCSTNSDRDTDIVDHIIVKKETAMRKIVLGAAGLVLALSVADANAIPLSQDATPYAVLGSAPPSDGIVSVIEGRSAFTPPAAADPGPAATPRLQARANR
jgi:hypothetical protein